MRISVVIPCYNAAAFITDALESVRRQTRPVDEVIVVDDCSTDGSPELIQRAGVRYVRTADRRGPAAARNVGIGCAGGDVVAFLDADDVWLPNHCEVVAGLLESTPDAGVAFSRVETFGELSLRPGTEFPTLRPFDALPSLMTHNFVPQPAAIVRRAALARVGGYAEDAAVSFAEDYDLWLRLAVHAAFVGTPAITVRYRVHPAQRSRQLRQQTHGRWVARRRILDGMTDPGAAAAYGERVRHAWRDELREAWISLDVALLDALLDEAPSVPHSAEIEGRWRRRRRLLWGAWRRLQWLRILMPAGTGRRLRNVIRPRSPL